MPCITISSSSHAMDASGHCSGRWHTWRRIDACLFLPLCYSIEIWNKKICIYFIKIKHIVQQLNSTALSCANKNAMTLEFSGKWRMELSEWERKFFTPDSILIMLCYVEASRGAGVQYIVSVTVKRERLCIERKEINI